MAGSYQRRSKRCRAALMPLLWEKWGFGEFDAFGQPVERPLFE